MVSADSAAMIPLWDRLSAQTATKRTETNVDTLTLIIGFSLLVAFVLGCQELRYSIRYYRFFRSIAKGG